MLEVLCGGVVISIAMLGHVASTLSEHQMAADGQYRSEALQLARQFIERMRGDEDFAGLLGRIRTVQIATNLPGGVALANGRRAYAPDTYYPDFVLPSELDSMVVRVEVPLDPTTKSLREDLDEPWFGLPRDLDGDGDIDAEARDDDYRALPLSLTFHWTPPGRPACELRFSTWLGGRR